MHPNSIIHHPAALTRSARKKRAAALEERSVRTRSMLIVLEPDRLHCWALIVALASSITGMALLISSALN